MVFTGELAIPRPEAKVRSAELGARPESRVTARTTVLVVGDGFVAADLRSGRLTGKARRVLELHERGQRIEVLSEGEFLQMVGGAASTPRRCPTSRRQVIRRNNHFARAAAAPSLER